MRTELVTDALRRAAATRGGLSGAVCTAIAGLVTSVHSVFFVATVKEGTVTWASVAGGVTVCAAVSLVIGTLAGRSSVRAAARWRPTGD
ncbi:hypothetical protein JS756_09990 [Streptomyces actuosus]|uniref:Uncharacterized protein n=1 Tax=Streptomyces actuosus TaxID=1885 RepID=A0ABS2VMV8_STRAS|nr:hypothetical protein [Streptomyces actuosus]